CLSRQTGDGRTAICTYGDRRSGPTSLHAGRRCCLDRGGFAGRDRLDLAAEFAGGLREFLLQAVAFLLQIRGVRAGLVPHQPDPLGGPLQRVLPRVGAELGDGSAVLVDHAGDAVGDRVLHGAVTVPRTRGNGEAGQPSVHLAQELLDAVDERGVLGRR